MVEALNDRMGFDHVVRVHADGTVTDVPDVYAPELHDGELDQPADTNWSLMTGYTGQYGYNGPMMHQSEFIGGGMERDILASPGLYVALINSAEQHTKSTSRITGDVKCSCGCFYCEDEPTDEPDGWAVAYIHDDAPEPADDDTVTADIMRMLRTSLWEPRPLTD